MTPADKAYSAISEDRKKREGYLNKIGSAAMTAGMMALPYTKIGQAAVQKLLPFLNAALPIDLALKGIRKVNPKIASYLEKGIKMGLDPEEGMNLVKASLPEAESGIPAAGSAAAVKKAADISATLEALRNEHELFDTVVNAYKKGLSLEEAAGWGWQNHPEAAKRLAKKEKKSWYNIVKEALQDFDPDKYPFNSTITDWDKHSMKVEEEMFGGIKNPTQVTEFNRPNINLNSQQPQLPQNQAMGQPQATTQMQQSPNMPNQIGLPEIQQALESQANNMSTSPNPTILKNIKRRQDLKNALLNLQDILRQ